mgnify:CR=1 FL=1
MTLRIGKARVLPDEIKKMIVELEGKTSPMSTLRTVVSALGHYEKNVPLNDLPPKALRLVGQIATAVAMIDRLRKKLPIITRGKMLAHIVSLTKNIVVVGSHGKTTTTSLAASILSSSYLDPTIINLSLIHISEPTRPY